MMSRLFIRSLLLASVILFLNSSLCAQDPPPTSATSSANGPAVSDPCDTQLAVVVSKLKSHLQAIKHELQVLPADQRSAQEANKRAELYDDVHEWSVYACGLTPVELQSDFFAEAEQTRLDKQPGATSNASGTTSLVDKGSSPSLLGFALEHGATTQSTDGNTVTYRGNVTNTLRALIKSSYLASYQLGENDPLVKGLAKVSFGVSFDTSSNETAVSQGFAPSSGNLSGFSVKTDLINHRDPREARYRNAFAGLVRNQGFAIAHTMLRLDDLVRHGPHYTDWINTIHVRLQSISLDAPDSDLQTIAKDARDLFITFFGNDPEIKQAFVEAAKRVGEYNVEKAKIYADIRKTLLFTAEYNYTRQLTTAGQDISATQPNQQLPSLSNINLVLEKGFHGAYGRELTLNAAVTFFNSTSANGTSFGSVRDYRANAQLDFTLREMKNIGRPVLSFSGQFLALLEQPLGQKIMLNGVTVDRRGNMGVFQSKLSIPIKDTGVKIPISFTYATRTELLKEKDVRGNVGITLDLDSLFAKAK
jgi:hypothetical protein